MTIDPGRHAWILSMMREEKLDALIGLFPRTAACSTAMLLCCDSGVEVLTQFQGDAHAAKSEANER